MEYLAAAMSISQAETGSVGVLEYIEQGLSLSNSLFALVVIIIGLSWLKPLKEKQSAASFTFWSQLRVRLIKVHSHLMANDNCLYYLYDPKVCRGWEGVLAPEPEDFRPLRKVIEETLDFLQKEDDQMPPYHGWTNEYTELLEYLTDIVAYDICDSKAKFKYTDTVEYCSLLQLRDMLCNLIESICEEIKSKQLSIENKLTIAWYKRICLFFRKNRQIFRTKRSQKYGSQHHRSN